MFTEARPFLLHALSSVHAGSGSDVGIVDLPIQREQHTGYPKIESSSLKGAIRATCSHKTKAFDDNAARKRISLVFGSEPEETGDKLAGAVAFSDARILLFPVKSMRGVFAWVTCPHVLKRFDDELSLYCEGEHAPLPIPEANTVSSGELLVANNRLVLEEYTFEVSQDETAEKLGHILGAMLFPSEGHEVVKRLVILDDDAFRDFVTLSTEVNARVKIDPKTGTAASSALWYEENVPPESVFYSFLFAGDVRGESTNSLNSAAAVVKFIKDDKHFPPVFQLGGNTTLGRGMLRRVWL